MNSLTQMQASAVKANELFARLAETSDGAVRTRERLFAELRAELALHASLEERHLFPILNETIETQALVADAIRDNTELQVKLAELDALPKKAETFLERLQELRKAFRQHARDEQRELLPVVQRALSVEPVQVTAEKLPAEVAGARQDEVEALRVKAEQTAQQEATEQAQRAAAEQAYQEAEAEQQRVRARLEHEEAARRAEQEAAERARKAAAEQARQDAEAEQQRVRARLEHEQAARQAEQEAAERARKAAAEQARQDAEAEQQRVRARLEDEQAARRVEQDMGTRRSSDGTERSVRDTAETVARSAAAAEESGLEVVDNVATSAQRVGAEIHRADADAMQPTVPTSQTVDAMTESRPAWTDWIGQTTFTGPQMSQALLQQAAKQQRQFVADAMRCWMEYNARVMRITTHMAQEGIRLFANCSSPGAANHRIDR